MIPGVTNKSSQLVRPEFNFNQGGWQYPGDRVVISVIPGSISPEIIKTPFLDARDAKIEIGDLPEIDFGIVVTYKEGLSALAMQQWLAVKNGFNLAVRYAPLLFAVGNYLVHTSPTNSVVSTANLPEMNANNKDDITMIEFSIRAKPGMRKITLQDFD